MSDTTNTVKKKKRAITAAEKLNLAAFISAAFTNNEAILTDTSKTFDDIKEFYETKMTDMFGANTVLITISIKALEDVLNQFKPEGWNRERREKRSAAHIAALAELVRYKAFLEANQLVHEFNQWKDAREAMVADASE